MATTPMGRTGITITIARTAAGEVLTILGDGWIVLHPSPDRLREWFQSIGMPLLYSGDAVSSDVVAPQGRLGQDRKVDDSPVYNADDILHDNR